jgi:hypothetical protein
MCSCKAVGIDGGISAGNRIVGQLSDMENRSMYCAIVQKKKVWLPIEGLKTDEVVYCEE